MSGSIGGGLPPIPTYLAIEKNETAAATKAASGNATTLSSVAHFSSASTTISSVASLLGDYKSLQVVLGAFGMSSAIGETAVLKDLMTQNPSSSSSLAYKSGNATWMRFAKEMSGWSSGATPLSASGAVTAIVGQYEENQYETQEGSSVLGLQQALYFTRTIGSDGSSLNALMSDPTQLNVVETVLGLDPSDFGALDFSEQQSILKNGIKWSQFSSTASIQRYAEQYLVMTQADPPSTAQSWSVGSLFENDDGADSLLGIIGQSLSMSA